MHRKASKPRAGRSRRRRIVRALALLIPLVLLAGIATVSLLTRPERIRTLAEGYLREQSGGLVRIRDAGFSLYGTIRLLGVSIRAQTPVSISATGSSVPEEPSLPAIFASDEVVLTFSPWRLLLGTLEVETIVAENPSCSLIHESASGITNLAHLLKASNPSAGRGGSPPIVELRNAEVLVYQQRDGELIEVERLRASARGRPAEGGKLYDIVWEETFPEKARGHAQLDLATGSIRNVEGGLPGLSIEAVMLAINARYDGVGAWSDLLGLDGRVQASDFDLIGQGEGGSGRSVRIDLEHARIAIPIDDMEADLPREQRYLRFDDVGGSVVASADRIDLNFSGLFHGSPARVEAKVLGGVDQLTSLADVAFSARLEMNDLTLPSMDEDAPSYVRRFIQRWHRLEHVYIDFDPSGVADLRIEVEKDIGPDEPIRLKQATIDVKRGSCVARFFPYRGHDMHGRIEVDSEGFRVIDLRGGNRDGSVVVNAFVKHPAAIGEANIDVAAKNVIVDDELREAMRPHFRRMYDEFDPTGHVDIHAVVARKPPVGEIPRLWTTRVDVDLVDVSAEYERFPYPLGGVEGRLAFEDDRIGVLGLTGGHGDARFVGNGIVQLREEIVESVDLTIAADGVPIDDTLHRALPPGMRKAVDALRAQGSIDVVCDVIGGEERGIDYATEVLLRGVDLRPEWFDFPLLAAEGRLDVTPARVIIDDVKASCAGGKVDVTGLLGIEGDTFEPDFTVRAEGVELSKRLVDAFPEAVRERIGKWHVRGPIEAAALQVRKQRESENLDFNVGLTLRGAEIRHPSIPSGFRDVSGRLRVEEGRLELDGLEGAYGEGRLAISGEIVSASDGATRGAMRLNLRGISVEEDFQGIIPEGAQPAWKSLSPNGKADVSLDSLTFETLPESDRTTWSVRGTARLSEFNADIFAALENARGLLRFDGQVVDDDGGLSLGGTLALDDAVWWDRRFERAEADWTFAHTAGGAGQFKMSNLQADLYGGVAQADMDLAYDESATFFDISAVARDVDVFRLINAGRDEDDSEDPAPVHGSGDGQIYLSGEVGNLEALRGGGRLQVREGSVYRMPIVLSILHVLNLALPEGDTFPEADTSFYVDGNVFDFTRITLNSSAVSLVGEGTMTVPDRAVDLTFVSKARDGRFVIPALGDLAEGATKELIQIHVTGSLDSPTVTPRPLRRLTDELRRLFQPQPERRFPAARSSNGR